MCAKFWANLYSLAKKVSHFQIIKNSHWMVLKPASEIRFIRHIKVPIKDYNIIRWY